jgi:FlaA1/EpsC-like NDP-sugar epimerase
MSITGISEAHSKRMEHLRTKAVKLFKRYSLPRWMVLVIDNLAVFIVFFAAYFLRFNFKLGGINFSIMVDQALITVCVYSIFSFVFHSNSGLIRHTTLTDISLVFTVTTVSALVLLGFSLCSRFFNLGEALTIPISIVLIHYVSISVCLFFERVLIKVLFRFATSSVFGTGSMRDKKKVLIYGAGDMGFTVKRVILSDPHGSYDVAGFLDNNKQLQGKMINNLPVFSPKILSKDFLLKHKINTLIIAINNLSTKIKSEIICKAIDLGLEILETPSFDKWMNGQLQLRQLQKVKLEELLGRDPIQLNLELIGKGLNDKVILVTGAAGSIGSEIVRQLTRFKIKRVILVDQAETPLFHLENELKSGQSQSLVKMILGDITQPAIMEDIFQQYHPEIVFHAAAYKHVPLMEANPHEAIRVNVGGTKLMAKLSVRYGVKKFVMISTDKAVNPTNVMGASKRICEMVVQMYAQKSGCMTQFIITRFGNVLGSNGSVIPIFAKQIENGGPVTVTHPEIKRYFMTIPEACQLVLEAGFMGNGGEIFVFDMGKPVKIADLARQMIRLSGYVPEKDIKIEFTGLRPGEKLYEELLTDNETTKPTYHPKIRIANVENCSTKELLLMVENLLTILYTLSKQEVVNYCRELIPEFKSNNSYFAQESKAQNLSDPENKVGRIAAVKPNLNDNILPSPNPR